ncbi:DNA recombinase [Gordoniibacillus kamchatkensis]|uniref:DNA recombinase n=1 Tax=Gordoniibacillus kamchatkensis TaxID=1590651 RepID=A0ABR5A3V2_9BACL|nr:recombinase family protein [Paenibacillus sp. VKM B-2647]KIL35729.1 DNA recombinase [Paenibacillus sp. VKM B-2647]
MYAIYARVSTEEQAKKGYSLQDQVRRCRKKIDAPSNEIIEYIDEGISGEFLERPQLTRLREDLRKGIIKTVVCLDPDRLSRDLNNALILANEIDKRAELVFVNGDYDKTPQGRLFFQIRGAIAEFEKATINMRMSNGRKEKARNGKVVKNYHVYGYTYNKEAGQMEIYNPEAEVVRLIFELFTNPQGRVRGINGIAHFLTKHRIPTKLQIMFEAGKTKKVPKNGFVWHKQVVRQILMNPAYKGEFYQNRWNTEGMLGNKFRDKEDRIQMTERPRSEWIRVPCPAIIDALTFDFVQEQLKEARRRFAGQQRNQYLLSGLLRCGDCGNTMVGRKSKNWGKYVFEYSDVKNTAGAKHKGCGNRIACEKLDSFVWDTFINLVVTRGQAAAEAAATVEGDTQRSFEEIEIERIENELQNIVAQRKGYYTMLAQAMANPKGIFKPSEIEEMIREANEREEALTKERDELAAQIERYKQNQFTEEILSETIEQFLAEGSPETLTLERKQEFLRKVFREIRVFDNGKVEFYKF